jgi:hypothetical protein
MNGGAEDEQDHAWLGVVAEFATNKRTTKVRAKLFRGRSGPEPFSAALILAPHRWRARIGSRVSH